MPIFNYEKTVLYSIDCKDTSIKYFFVGFTTNFTKTKYKHKCNTKEGKNDLLYNNINNNGGWTNWNITILEKCKCNNRNEVLEKQKKWEDTLENAKNPPKIQQNPPNNEIIVLENKCIYCNRMFTRSDSLKKHVYERCKIKKNQELVQKLLEEQIAQKFYLLDLLNKL